MPSALELLVPFFCLVNVFLHLIFMEMYWRQKIRESTKQILSATQSANQHLRAHRHRFIRVETDLSVQSQSLLSQICCCLYTSRHNLHLVIDAAVAVMRYGYLCISAADSVLHFFFTNYCSQLRSCSRCLIDRCFRSEPCMCKPTTTINHF